MKITFRKYAVEGEYAPWGYGMGYFDYSSGRLVLYPIPLNWIIWAFREIYFRLMVTPIGIQKTIGTQQYADGWVHGYHEGFEEGKREAEQSFFDTLDRMVTNDRNRLQKERDELDSHGTQN